MAANIVAQMQILINAQTRGLNTALSQSTSALKGLESAISTTNKALTAFGIGIGVSTVANIAGEVIEVTSQFEKFGAVLANTLGSQSAAQAALDSIREFAQETPFEVAEVTAAYVRWANQGLNPTIDKMGKLGDVASSLGAGFEQTAEAFKDLLVGQTKRIEEIGISAQQSNGKIQLSFKGVNLEIEKSVAGVEEALNVFSQLQGVQGTSAQVSETLGGRISNLKDAYSNLLLTLGESTDATKSSVDFFIELTNGATNLIKKLNETDNSFGKFLDGFSAVTTAPIRFLLDLINGTEEVNDKLSENEQKLKAIAATVDAAFASGNIEAYIKALDQNIFKEEIIAEIRRRQVAEKAALEQARLAEIVTLDKLQAKLKELNTQFEETDTNDKKKLANIGQQILATNAQIDSLERLRKKQEEVGTLQTQFAKDQLKNASLKVKTEVDADLTTSTLGGGFLTQIPAPEIGPAMDALFTYTEAVKAAGVAGIQSTEQQILANQLLVESEQRKAEMAQAVGQIIGDAAGDVITGQKTVLQALAGITQRLLPIFLSQALAGTIAGAGKTAAPPPAIIAMAVAGVAAISSLFAKATGHSRSVGGAGAAAGARATTNVAKLQPVPSQTESIQFDAKFRLEGKDLVASVNSTNNAGGRLSG